MRRKRKANLPEVMLSGVALVSAFAASLMCAIEARAPNPLRVALLVTLAAAAILAAANWVDGRRGP